MAINFRATRKQHKERREKKNRQNTHAERKFTFKQQQQLDEPSGRSKVFGSPEIGYMARSR